MQDQNNKPSPSRRQFNLGLAAASLAAATAGVGINRALAATLSAVHAQDYRYRFRFFRKGGKVSVWVRVVSLAGYQIDVPATVLISRHPSADFTSGENANQPYMLVSRQATSTAASNHTIRAGFKLKSKGVTRQTPLYCRLYIGNEKTPSKVWALNRQTGGAA